MAENMKIPTQMKSSKHPTCTHKRVTSQLLNCASVHKHQIQADLLVALSQCESKSPEAGGVTGQL